MEVAFLIPWRPDGGHRDDVWRRLKQRHLDLGRTVVEGAPPDGPWVKALAVAEALDRTDAHLLVIHDADVWCDGVDDAIAAVEAGAPWAMPHRLVHRLAEGRDEPTTDPKHLDQNPYIGWPAGGIVVLTRSTYLACPMPALEGWGQEDEAWAVALECLHGPVHRGRAPLFHWWHPPQPRKSRVVGSAAGLELLQRYKAARRHPSAMRRFVDEGRQAWRSDSSSTGAA